ncbi:hypothetical protein D9M73_154120 [compost metagenome]
MHQVEVLGIAPSAGEGDFAAMGGKAGGAQGQYQFFAAGDRQQHRGLGETAVVVEVAWGVRRKALAQFIQHAVGPARKF